MPSTVIVTVNYNGLGDTLRCLRSLAAIHDRDTSVVVVDNASTEDPAEAVFREAPGCRFIRLAENTGWAGGNNEGLRIALDEMGAERVLLLNNDTIVNPRIVSRLRAAGESGPEYGIFGPVIHFMEEPEVVMTDGCLFNRSDSPGFFGRKVVPVDATDPPRLAEVDIVNGCAMMISARVARAIGPIDERFFLIHEESDYCLRARRAGFKCGVLAEALVWHKGSSSFKRGSAAGPALLRCEEPFPPAPQAPGHGRGDPRCPGIVDGICPVCLLSLLHRARAWPVGSGRRRDFRPLRRPGRSMGLLEVPASPDRARHPSGIRDRSTPSLSGRQGGGRDMTGPSSVVEVEHGSVEARPLRILFVKPGLPGRDRAATMSIAII